MPISENHLQRKKAYLTPLQLKVISRLISRPIGQSVTKCAEEMGLSHNRVNRWMSSDHFLEVLYELQRERIRSGIIKVDEAMLEKAIEDKDVNAAKLVYQRAGIDKNSQNNANSPQKIELSIKVSDELADSILNSANKIEQMRIKRAKVINAEPIE